MIRKTEPDPSVQINTLDQAGGGGNSARSACGESEDRFSLFESQGIFISFMLFRLLTLVLQIAIDKVRNSDLSHSSDLHDFR
ncbi:hypothetical protein PMIT1306_02547 [Prochlorococcus sp. MIT 1306]|nr:hypothetical protein PMIT1306_02547 [Prochlorococcus sp. MIT 1306]